MDQPDYQAMYDAATRRVSGIGKLREAAYLSYESSLQIGSPKAIDDAHHDYIGTVEVWLDMLLTRSNILLRSHGIDPDQRHLG